jgi:hypothetical protein
MYCWPPLPLIYIEEGESPFIIIIIVLFSLYLSSWRKSTRIHEETPGEVMKGKEDIFIGSLLLRDTRVHS